MNLIKFIPFFIILAFSVSFHELMHGWTAYKLGDPTAKFMGRLTLNPLAHIDPIGTILLPLIMFMSLGTGFAYAKPVPINYASLRNPKRDMMIIGFSGPFANFLLAFVLALILKLNLINNFSLFELLVQGIQLNLFLAVLNLIPIPPLDGSRILIGILPRPLAASYAQLEPYGFIILLVMLFLGLIGKIIVPIVHIITSFLLF